jgi:hypothetical protein
MCTLALVLAAQVADQQKRRDHARKVVGTLGLDPRLADFIPLPPRKRKLRPHYDQVLSVLQEVSSMSEPERSRVIDDVRLAAAAAGWRA